MATATISSLNVALGLTSDVFTKGLKQAESGLSGFLKSVTSTTGLITGALAAIGVGASAAGIKAFVSGQMEAIDATAKLADRLGVSTEAMAGLEHAASLAGVSTEQLAGGMEKMLQALAGADDEGGKAAKAFADMGLSVQRLSGLTTDQIFTQIAQGLSGIDNPARRAADAVAIFGKAGQQLLPLMMSGAEGIRAAQAEAEKLGLTFSHIDGQKIQAANDAMTRMHAVLTGMGRTIAIEVAPYVEALAVAFTKLGTNGKAGTGAATAGVNLLLLSLAKAADYAKLLEAVGMGIGLTFGRVAFAFTSVANLIVQSSAIMRNTGWGQSLKSTAEGMDTTLTKLQADMRAAVAAFSNGSSSKAAAAWLQQVKADADKAAAAVRGSGGAFQTMGKDIEGALEPLKKLGSALDSLKQELATFGMSQRQRQLFDLTEQRNAIQQQLNAASSGFFQQTGGATTTSDPRALAKLAEVDVLSKQLADAEAKVREAQGVIARLQGLETRQAQGRATDTLFGRTPVDGTRTALPPTVSAPSRGAFEGAAMNGATTKESLSVQKQTLNEQKTQTVLWRGFISSFEPVGVASLDR